MVPESAKLRAKGSRSSGVVLRKYSVMGGGHTHRRVLKEVRRHFELRKFLHPQDKDGMIGEISKFLSEVAAVKRGEYDVVVVDVSPDIHAIYRAIIKNRKWGTWTTETENAARRYLERYSRTLNIRTALIRTSQY